MYAETTVILWLLDYWLSKNVITCYFSTQSSKFPVSIKAPVGELLQGCPMTEADFLAKQGLSIS